jgi:catechol 2,3-dioxygenase-like lactoylglutathione lyase family enzyme
MFNKVDYVMVNVSEMGRSVAFYRDTLGLLLKFESSGWSEFQTGATTLALHPGVPRSVEAGDAQAGSIAGTCSLGFSVKKLDATYAELKARGARFVMAPTDQVNEGIRLAVCIDPDGLPISFAESIVREASSRELTEGPN